uniref:HAT C-terminal dimerisation domain-containing protein n=1 Tax=Globodera rostochiensis TaxID=31243 RepID=A0A914HRW1_GLORO
MINHLKTKNHEDALKLFESENAEMTPKLTSVWAQKNAEADLQNKLDEQLVRIMVRQNVSFDDQDLQELVKLAYPGQQIFSRMHFTRSVIPCMAGEIRTNIVKQIGSNKFSITSDGWMKPSKFPALLSVTTHTISADFQRMDNVIATIEILSEHTGEEIARLIENFLVENGLSIGSIVACVRDNARNMQKSCRLLGIDSFQCSAHMYHLSVRDALRCNNDYLREISDLQRRPTNFSQNEWNNLKRLEENLEPLSREDFVIIGELCKVLKVFHVETCRLSQEQSTASAYIPTAKKILLFLRERRCRNADVQMISENLAQNLQVRLAAIESNKILRLSMLVDPRFAFDENFLLGFEWEILEDEFIHLIIREKDSVSTTTVAEARTAEFDDQEFAEVGIDPLDEDSMDIDLWARDAEFNLFRHGIVRLGRDENVFEWWSNNKFRFPLIAEGAKRFLSVPATSVSSERTFSMAGLLYANTLRNRLGAKMAENLMLIKASLKKTMLAPSV